MKPRQDPTTSPVYGAVTPAFRIPAARKQQWRRVAFPRLLPAAAGPGKVWGRRSLASLL